MDIHNKENQKRELPVGFRHRISKYKLTLLS
jgi:hypothetical protein